MSGLHESCICPEESSLAGALSGGHSQSAVSGGPRQGRHGCKAHSPQSCQSFSTGYALYAVIRKIVTFGPLNQMSGGTSF